MSEELMGGLLREVSRSFYLTLRVLPRRIRAPISLAYLLARATDTIADTNAVPRAKRVVLLRQLQSLSRVPELGAIAEEQTTAGERKLLQRLEDCVAALDRLQQPDRRRIEQLLRVIVAGQIFDLERFPGPPLSAEELDRYTYMVAGCVGEFWTVMCQAHLPGLQRLSVEDGVRFGKGLQLVNVLRDVAEDRQRGRQYVPELEQSAQWLDRAVEYLEAGWRYTMAIPLRWWRLRLACVWPIWIGLKTISRLRRSDPTGRAARVKISRAEVYAIIARSALCVWSDALLRVQFARLRRQALSR